MKEEVRKPGYLPNEEIWEMDASYTDQNLAEIKLTKEVENQPTESQFTKTDATTGEELEGAKLQIIDKEGKDVYKRQQEVWEKNHAACFFYSAKEVDSRNHSIF